MYQPREMLQYLYPHVWKIWIKNFVRFWVFFTYSDSDICTILFQQSSCRAASDLTLAHFVKMKKGLCRKMFLFLKVRHSEKQKFQNSGIALAPSSRPIPHLLFCLPDACLGKPRLVPDGRHSCVHEGVGLDELQGIIRELYGALKGRSWTMTCTAPGSRIEGAHTHRHTHRGQKVKDQPIRSHTRD